MTQLLSKKARICAIITALLLLLTALWTPRLTAASADYWDVPEFDIDLDHVCTDSCYKNIYYLTDNMESQNYVNGFLGDLVDAYAKQHSAFNEFKYYDLEAIGWASWRGTLEKERFGDPAMFFNGSLISNALVIYELNYLLPFQFSNDATYWPTFELYDRFYTMKSNNCKIMFICNTDEKHFNDVDASNCFLDLVDVHINTDIYSSFTQTFLTFFEEKLMNNSTIILDKSMSYPAIEWLSVGVDDCEYRENNYVYMSNVVGMKYGNRYAFLDGMLLPYIRKKLGLTRMGKYSTNTSLLQGERINILCYLGEEMFYDIAKGEVYYWAIDNQKFSDSYMSDHYYFVGSTRYGNSYELRRILKNIEKDEGNDEMFDKYLFVEYDSYQTIQGESNMHTAGLSNSSMADFIAPIVADFLFDDIYPVDWDSIDNWVGRCKVTVKPTSDDSWLLPLSGPEDTICEPEEHDYYDDWY